MSDFKAKMHQIRFPLGLCPRTSWGSLQHSLDLLTVFKGATSKGTERKGEEKERGKGSSGKGVLKRGGGRDGRKGREGKGFISRILLFKPWQLCHLWSWRACEPTYF